MMNYKASPSAAQPRGASFMAQCRQDRGKLVAPRDPAATNAGVSGVLVTRTQPRYGLPERTEEMVRGPNGMTYTKIAQQQFQKIFFDFSQSTGILMDKVIALADQVEAAHHAQLGLDPHSARTDEVHMHEGRAYSARAVTAYRAAMDTFAAKHKVPRDAMHALSRRLEAVHVAERGKLRPDAVRGAPKKPLHSSKPVTVQRPGVVAARPKATGSKAQRLYRHSASA